MDLYNYCRRYCRVTTCHSAFGPLSEGVGALWLFSRGRRYFYKFIVRRSAKWSGCLPCRRLHVFRTRVGAIGLFGRKRRLCPEVFLRWRAFWSGCHLCRGCVSLEGGRAVVLDVPACTSESRPALWSSFASSCCSVGGLAPESDPPSSSFSSAAMFECLCSNPESFWC